MIKFKFSINIFNYLITKNKKFKENIYQTNNT